MSKYKQRYFKMQQNKPLTFKEFVATDPVLQGHRRYDNFFLYFTTDGPAAPFIRHKPHTIRFIGEHSDLEQKLREGVMHRDRSMATSEAIKPIEADLYKAYTIMHGYGASDDDLLIAPK